MKLRRDDDIVGVDTQKDEYIATIWKCTTVDASGVSTARA
jgi:hypothetical protein